MIETNKVTVRSSMLPISDSGKEHTTTLQGHLGQQTQALNNSIARNNKGITELFAEKRKVDDELADTKEAHAQWLGETGKLAYTNNWLANTGGTGFYKAEREAVAKNENFTQKINVLQKQSDTYTQLIDSTTQNSKASLAHETSTITGGGQVLLGRPIGF
ncbi:hypothetical protein C4K03_4718 [Pseudomonas synxantha]|uniref:Uncharacterized protein n=1 Tax=Pseudomonas synxantha TaxID=47883 RepID=A0A3G7UE92_9PSED|nr:hypothetical protein [Pseudomonas synxantha]AZE56856.1 hypothetical protein C4K03_4718 [Pseudomonas synxantha]